MCHYNTKHRFLMKNLLLVLSLTFAAGTVSAQQADSAAAPAPETEVSFASLYAAAGLDSVLAKDVSYTVFAPSTDALKSAAGLQGAELQKVLLAHVVKGSLVSTAITGDTTLVSLAGSSIDIKKTDAGISVNGASVLAADAAAGNIITHTISAVITVAAGPVEAVPAQEVKPAVTEPVKEAAADDKANKKSKKAKKTKS
jgi:uncharacterized surface protein with fasciclin (FAS1) repeats